MHGCCATVRLGVGDDEKGYRRYRKTRAAQGRSKDCRSFGVAMVVDEVWAVMMFELSVGSAERYCDCLATC